MSEYENYDEAAAAYDEVAAYDATELDPSTLGAVSQQAGDAAARRVLAEVLQAQQQGDQFRAMQEISAVAAEAERRLTAADPSWPSRQATAARVIGEHPSFVSPEAMADPEKMATALWRASAFGEAVDEDQRLRQKAGEDEAFGDRIVRAHQKSYSAFRQATDAGKSVHDILGDS